MIQQKALKHTLKQASSERHDKYLLINILNLTILLTRNVLINV